MSCKLPRCLRCVLQPGTYIGLAVIAILWAGFLLYLARQKESALQGAEQNVSNLSRLLEENTTRIFDAADSVMEAMQAVYARDPDRFDFKIAHAFLNKFVLRIDLIGPDGILVASTSDVPDRMQLDLRDRPNFRVHAKDAKDNLIISPPAVDRTTDKVFIYLSRRLTKPDSSFGGVITASIDQAELAKFYNSIDLGHDGTVAVIGRDKIVRFSRGFKNLKPDSPYRASMLFSKLAEHESGTFTTPGGIDGIARLVGFRALKQFPLIVSVGLAEHEILAGYYRETRRHGIPVGIVTVFIIIAMTWNVRRERKLLESAEQLMAAQQTLEHSEERYRLVESATSNGIWDWDILTGNRYFSRRWLDMLGYSQEDMSEIPLGFFGLVHPGDKTAIARALETCIETNAPCSVDVRLRRKEGRYCWVHMRGRVVHDADGKPMRMTGTITDITERKAAQAELEESRGNLARAENMANMGHVKYLQTTDEYTWSEGVYRIMGKTPDTFTPDFRNSMELIHPDDRALMMQYRENVMAGLKPGRITARANRDDGKLLYLEFQSEPVYGDDGSVIGLFSTLQDITRRKQTQMQVEESLDSLARAEQMASLGHLKLEIATGKYIWSAGAYRVMGQSPDRFTPQVETVMAIVHPDDRSALLCYRDDVMADRNPPRLTVRVRRADGQFNWVESWSMPLRDNDGRVIGLFGTIQDVTERKQAQARLEESLENLARAEQIAGLGHLKFDMTTGECTWSAGAYRVMGQSPDTFVPTEKNSAEVIHPDDRELLLQHRNDVMAGHTSPRFMLRVLRADGQIGYIESWMTPLRDSDGKVIGRFGTLLDITERKQAQAFLEESLENLARAEQMAGLGYIKHNTTTGEYVWSAGTYRIFGQSPATFTPTLEKLAELVHPDDREILQQQRDNVMADRMPPRIVRRVLRADGQIRFVESWMTPLRDGDGKVIGRFGTVLDVTERKKAEILIEEQRDNLAHAETMAQLGHYKFDQNSNVLTWSEGLYRIMGHSPDTIKPTLDSVLEIFHPDDHPALEKYRRDVLAGHEPPPITLRCIKFNGTQIYIENWARPLRDSQGAIVGMFGTIQDVTERKHAEEELSRTNAFFKAVIDNMPILLTVKKADDLSYVAINPAAARTFGISAESVIGKCTSELARSDTATLFESLDHEALQNCTMVRFEHDLEDHAGASHNLIATKVPILDADGTPEYLITLAEDITERKQAERALARTHQELVDKQFAIDQAVTVAIADPQGKIIHVNDLFCKISGYAREELLGSNHRILKSGAHPKSFYQDMYQTITAGWVWRGEVCDKAKDGTLYWVDSTIVPQFDADGALESYMAISFDITAQKQAEAKIAYMAGHDALTGLGNRTTLNETLRQALSRSQQHETFAVLLLDLDGFKNVNDTLGHAAGDELLKRLASRLKSTLRAGDYVARLGGDEFAVVQNSATDQREAASALAERMLEAVGVPFELEGREISVGTSIGIVLAPEHGASVRELLQKADLALYKVKAEGRNGFRIFDETMTRGVQERLNLLHDLRGALGRAEFDLHYQPIYDAKTRQPCAAEALLRWRHPTHGLILPERFIPLAEESGLIDAIGAWVLAKACADATTWPNDIKVAVNLSPRQFRTGQLFDIVSRALADAGLSPGRLELEITESVLMQDLEQYSTALRRFKALGVSIVLDDFGTGYSSLGYLTTFPFDKIKIDKSFTQGITSNAACAASVASVLTLARSLNMIVTAEGVETKQQFELLRAAGVHQVQGYYFAKPDENGVAKLKSLPRSAA